MRIEKLEFDRRPLRRLIAQRSIVQREAHSQRKDVRCSHRDVATLTKRARIESGILGNRHDGTGVTPAPNRFTLRGRYRAPSPGKLTCGHDEIATRLFFERAAAYFDVFAEGGVLD